MKELHTLGELRDLLDEIQVRGAIPVRFLLDEENEEGAILVAGAMSIVDVHDGVTPIVATERAPIALPVDRVEVMALCRELAYRMYRHEVDEQFYYAGFRVIDMHGSHVEDRR